MPWVKGLRSKLGLLISWLLNYVGRMEEVINVFEVFNLDDVSSDDIIDFNFPLPLDSEGEDDKEQLGIVEEANVDPF